jgi:hypothetical protein
MNLQKIIAQRPACVKELVEADTIRQLVELTASNLWTIIARSWSFHSELCSRWQESPLEHGSYWEGGT